MLIKGDRERSPFWFVGVGEVYMAVARYLYNA